ncbi:Cytochrome c oxidase subunit 6 [Dissophora globulifera]|nr:Cytochrome c oxidase subunit 6 [Dissophora globulifera]
MTRLAAISRPLAAAARVQVARSAAATHSAVQIRNYSSEHGEESFEHFTERFVKFFDNVDDVFELQRGLNNAFGYDLVPSPSVIAAALKASRRVDDYATAVRVFEGLKFKAGSDALYKQYLDELAPLKAELGVETKEELGL